MIRRVIFFCLAAALPVWVSGNVPAPQGPVTDYTRWLDREERNWVTSRQTAAEVAPSLQCYHHPDRAFYIGTKSALTIHAPLASVEKVLDDVNGYQDIFFGFVGIKLSEKTDQGFVVSWHRPVPVFFIPDLRYQVVYQVTKGGAGRKTYRFQMKEKIDLLKGLDGMIVLEARDAKTTLFTQFLFLDGRYGPLETFDPGKIWTDGVRDFYLANLGVKTKAENPTLDREPLRTAIQNAYQAEKVQTCIANKTLHGGLKSLEGDTP